MTIVPTTKLIVLAAVVLLPLSVLVAVMPATAGPGVLLVAVLGLCVGRGTNKKGEPQKRFRKSLYC